MDTHFFTFTYNETVQIEVEFGAMPLIGDILIFDWEKRFDFKAWRFKRKNHPILKNLPDPDCSTFVVAKRGFRIDGNKAIPVIELNIALD